MNNEANVQELNINQTLTSSMGEGISQYLTFILATEEYGIDILSVVEIRGWETPTTIPSAPKCIKGVINLRGNIIPVVDLRSRFNMPEIPYGPSTVLIVIQMEYEKHKKMIGIVVDAVSDVYSVNIEQKQSKPEACDSPGHEYISSLVTIKQENAKDKLVIILEPKHLFNFKEFDRNSVGVNNE